MPFEYRTISEKEKIKDKYVANVIDYFERHTKEDFISVSCNNHFDYMFNYGIYSLGILKTEKIAIYNNKTYITIIELNKKIFSENISGIYGSITSYLKKQGMN